MAETKIVVIVFHPEGGNTIKSFIRPTPLPASFGLYGCLPVSLFRFSEVTNRIRFFLEKNFSTDTGELLAVHPELNKIPDPKIAAHDKP